jgi:hypothetical protein
VEEEKVFVPISASNLIAREKKQNNLIHIFLLANFTAQRPITK